MTITAILNGVKVKKQIPSKWSEVTFQHYMDLFGVSTTEINKILSVFTGIEESVLIKAKIINLDMVIQTLSFMRTTTMSYAIPKYILGYPIPKDLNFETTGQFKDVQGIADSFPKVKPGEDPAPMSKEDQMKYIDIVATYAMKDYCDASHQGREAFAKQFLNAPCEEVLAIGNFTLLKLIGLNLNIKKVLPSKSGRLRTLMLAIKIWRINTAFSLLFWRLRRLAGLKGTSL